jgi:hypothetical protein
MLGKESSSASVPFEHVGVAALAAGGIHVDLLG